MFELHENADWHQARDAANPVLHSDAIWHRCLFTHYATVVTAYADANWHHSLNLCGMPYDITMQ